MTTSITLGMIGCGNIGSEFVDVLDERRAAIAATSGIDLRLTRIGVADLGKSRSPAVGSRVLTDDVGEVIDDDEIDIVVELAGDVDGVRDIVLRTLRSGKSVVTGNKALIALSGPELFAQARESGVDLLFEAATVAGVPILRPLRESLVGEEVTSIAGILNGTTNYVLSRMANESMDYDAALAQAQALGLAEPDPTADVEGIDSASKLAILSSVAFNHSVPFSAVHSEGIVGMDRADMEIAAGFGYAIKSLAVAEARWDDGQLVPCVRAQIFPALVPLSHPLASVHDAFNAVFVRGRDVGELMFYGQGAGRRPTASAVLGDVVDAAHNRISGISRTVPVGPPAAIGSVDDMSYPYYLRLDVADAPGVLSEVSGVFGAHGISLRVVEQHDSVAGVARVVFVTYRTTERAFRAAMADLVSCASVRRTGQVLRIFAD
ncbi:MAG: homoserine dehydrogenase [Pseudonocardiaceae bacterium]